MSTSSSSTTQLESSAVAISEDKKVLPKIRPRQALRFVHITKCAGTSIEDVSGNQWGRYDTEYRDSVSDMYCHDGSWWHLPLLYVRPAYVLKDLLKKYDYFCVVRNPFDRVISEYFCKWGGPKFKATTAADFNRWIHKRLRSVRAEPVC